MLYGEDIQNDFNFSHRVFMKGIRLIYFISYLFILFISYSIYPNLIVDLHNGC